MARAVTAFATFLRDPYRAGSGPVVQPWIAPERRTLITFRQLWPILSLGVICGVLVIATLPLQKDVTGFLAAVVIAAAYAFFSALFYCWEQRNAGASLRVQQNVRGLRKIAMIAGLTATIWFLPTVSSEVWLLYLVPMLTVGVDLDRRWALTLIALTMALMFASAFPQGVPGSDPAQLLTDSRDGLMRALAGGYVGLTSYLLARCLAYQYRAGSEAVRQLLQAPATQRWSNTVDVVADLVAELFSEKESQFTANVLIFDSQKGKMRLAGSSLPDGQRLARGEFAFPVTQGITGWAAVHNQPCFLNDTEQDPEGRFLPNEAFPNTRSALAVPFPLGARERAVLEIESPTPRNIAYEDMQLLELIASYLAGAYQASEWIEFHRRLAELGQDLADRIIHVQEIGATLAKIGEVALDMVDADVIGFFYCDPQTGLIEERCLVGDLLAPGVCGSPVNTKDGLVYQLMQQGEPQFFGSAQEDERLIRRSAWHKEHDVQPFVIREQIVSCSAIPLVLGQERLGLMWVNYRQAQDFPKPLQYGLQMVAPFAALAIKSGIQSAQAERRRREKLHRDLHDSLSARLNNAARALDRLSFCSPGSDRWKETFQLAQLSVKWATTVVSALLGRQEWMTLQSIVADLRTHADVSSRVYGVQVRLQAGELPVMAINHAGGNELLFACNEAINNALCHAQASNIDVCVGVANDCLCITVCDDGVGFDPSTLVRVHGIQNMRARVEQSLAGHFTLDSQPGSGTRVRMTVPLAAAGAEKETDRGATE